MNDDARARIDHLIRLTEEQREHMHTITQRLVDARGAQGADRKRHVMWAGAAARDAALWLSIVRRGCDELSGSC